MESGLFLPMDFAKTFELLSHATTFFFKMGLPHTHASFSVSSAGKYLPWP